MKISRTAVRRRMREYDIAALRKDERERSLAMRGKPEEVASVAEISAGGVPA